MFFLKQKGISDEQGPGRYSFRASRYDYLRIAKAIMDAESGNQSYHLLVLMAFEAFLLEIARIRKILVCTKQNLI